MTRKEALYSTSVVERDTESCFLLHQETPVEPQEKT